MSIINFHNKKHITLISNIYYSSKNLLKEMNKRYRTQNFNSNAAGDDSSYNDWQLKRFMNQ